MAAVINMPEQTLDSRVARLESDVAHIRTDVADIKVDIRQVRGEIAGLRGEMNSRFTEVRGESARQFRWLVGLMVTMVLTVLAAMGGVIAAVIHWH